MMGFGVRVMGSDMQLWGQGPNDGVWGGSYGAGDPMMGFGVAVMGSGPQRWGLGWQ